MSERSAIRSLAMAIYHRWEPSRLFLFMDELTAYIDESGTHGSSVYTVMTGLVGYVEQWEKFENKWKELTGRARVPYIHGRELRPGRAIASGVFKDQTIWPENRRKLLAATAVNLAKEHFLFGITVVLQNSDYDTYYKMADKRGRPAVASKYGVCAHVLIANMVLLLQHIAPGSEVHLVVEDGHRNEGAIRDIVDEWHKYDVSRRARYISPYVTYVRKADSPGVQAADLAAYPDYLAARDSRVNAIPMKVEDEFSLPPVKGPRFRVVVDEDVFTQLKRGEYVTRTMRRRYGRHWARLQGLPNGWSVKSLASAPPEYLLVPPRSELRGLEDDPPFVQACCVHLRCQ